MSVKEIEREIVKDPDLDKKMDPPKRYGVVFRSEGILCQCGINVLCDVFNYGAAEAYGINTRAALMGEPTTVFTGDKDIAFTKAQDAEVEKRMHGDHNPFINMLSFKCEPLA